MTSISWPTASARSRGLPDVHVHHAARPLGWTPLGEPLLRVAAGRWRRKLSAGGVRTIANGGNADAGDVNWVHYVHAAFDPRSPGRVALVRPRLEAPALPARRKRRRSAARGSSSATAAAPQTTSSDAWACDASRTRRGVLRHRSACVRSRRIPGSAPRHDARSGSSRTGRSRCSSARWAIGARVSTRCSRRGSISVAAATGTWICSSPAPARNCRRGMRVPLQRRSLGASPSSDFDRDMPAVLAAADVLVHPARYEAYGLAVHEALCRGIPAIVSREAGVAERYPAALEPLAARRSRQRRRAGEPAAELAGRPRRERSGRGRFRQPPRAHLGRHGGDIRAAAVEAVDERSRVCRLGSVLGLRRRTRARLPRGDLRSPRLRDRRIRSWRSTPGRRFVCAAAATADSRSRSACRRCRVLRSDVRPALVERLDRAGIRRHLQGRDLPEDPVGAARTNSQTADRCSISARTPGGSSHLARAAGWAPEGLELNPRTAAFAATAPDCRCIVST